MELRRSAGPARSARTALVWSALREALAARGGTAGLAVLDAGGGTGGFAVPLAELGHRVTVVDPSPDSLAALERRAAEAGVTTVRAVQGGLDDPSGLLDVVAPDSCDVVLCHHVLEVVDDPVAAVDAVRTVLRPGGLVSVLAANRAGAALSRVVAGRLDEAVHVLTDPAGRFGPGDPLARRFDQEALGALLAAAGLRVESAHGARIVTDLLPGSLLDADAATYAAVVALEEAAAGQPALAAVGAAVHVLATKT